MGLRYQPAAPLSPKPGASKGRAWLFTSARALLTMSVGNQNQKPASIGVWEVELAGFNPSDTEQDWTGTGKVLDDQWLTRHPSEEDDSQTNSGKSSRATPAVSFLPSGTKPDSGNLNNPPEFSSPKPFYSEH
ncbi:hypothetical protein STEG23_027354 [Scotinomys teguina]